jgi:hypothetical protein
MRTVELDVIYASQQRKRERLGNAYQAFCNPKLQTNVLSSRGSGTLESIAFSFMLLQVADLLEWHTHRDFLKSKKSNIHSNAVSFALKDLPKVVDDTWYENELTFAIRGLR